ncbi:MAG: FecR domain-containing protein [Bacteroidota bacterium]
MDYSYYSEEDFILDESFIDWFKQKDAANNDFWEDWVEAHPEKKETVDNALKFLRTLHVAEEVFTTKDTQQEWQAIEQILFSTDSSKTQPSTTQQSSKHTLQPFFGVWYKVAAAVVGIMLVGAAYWIIRPFGQERRYTTGYGETQLIKLPDGSFVTLNAHSSLSYDSEWSNENTREVWLEGEAFFHVLKKQEPKTTASVPAGNAKFVVHTSNLNVEVIGTQFNVKDRRGNTQVVLKAGKVRLANNVHPSSDTLVMAPGELVQFYKRNASLIKKKVNPELYSSWRKNILIFDRTPLYEVASLIEDNYGIEVVFENKSQANKILTGTIPVNNLDVLLLALSKSFDLRVSREENRIILKNNQR